MIVKEVKVYVVDTGSHRPVVAELITDEGISGIGEAAVGFGVGCNAAAAMIADLAKAFVVGKDPSKITDIWNDFYYHTFWGKGAGAIFYAAVSAIEIALWDIKGKCLKAPIYELLGGRQRDVINVYANDWSFNLNGPEEVANRAKQVVADGFDSLKLYPMSLHDKVRNMNHHVKNRAVGKELFTQAVKTVEAVRRAIGDDIDLLIDVTAEGTPDVMTQFGKAIEEFKPGYYEEPLDAFDLDSYVGLKAKVNIPIATGERTYTRYGYRRLLELRVCDIVQPDAGTCGGILETFHIGAMAEAYSMRIAPHNCGGPVLTAASVQLSACLSNFYSLETFPYRPELHYNILENPFEKQIKNGRLNVPTLPGLGVELNRKAVEPFLTARVTL